MKTETRMPVFSKLEHLYPHKIAENYLWRLKKEKSKMRRKMANKSKRINRHK